MTRVVSSILICYIGHYSLFVFVLQVVFIFVYIAFIFVSIVFIWTVSIYYCNIRTCVTLAISQLAFGSMIDEPSIIHSSEQSPDSVLHGAAQDLPAYAPHSHIPSRGRDTTGPSLFCISICIGESNGIGKVENKR